EDRNQVRAILDENEFIEIYVKCSLDTCEKRDPKGMYKKARAGEIKSFTGIDAPYEKPVSPEITVDTENNSLEKTVQVIIQYLRDKKYLSNITCICNIELVFLVFMYRYDDLYDRRLITLQKF